MSRQKEGLTSTATLPGSPPASLLKADQVADRLNLSVRSVRRMIKDGRLPVVRLGRSVRIRPETLAAIIGEE